MLVFPAKGVHLRFAASLILVLLLAPVVSAQLLLKLDKDSLRSFVYSGGDEFNATELNLAAWKDSQWPGVNMPQEFVYTNRNVKLQQGLLLLEMTRKDSVYRVHPLELDSHFLKEKKLVLPNNQYLFHYEAGSIVSKQKYHYGLYSLRFKVEEGKGVWPAFWFFGGYKNEEIDVFELKGERNRETHVDTHCPYGCGSGYKNKLGFNSSWGGWLPLSDYLHEGFNLAQLEWTAEGLTWYMNSYPLAWFRGDFKNPMHIFINTQVAKDGRAFKPGPDESTVFPNTFFVDYVRIWQRDVRERPTLMAGDWQLSQRFASRYDIKPTKKRGLMYSRARFKTEAIVELWLQQNGRLDIVVTGEKRNALKLRLVKLDGNPNSRDVSAGSLNDLSPGDYELHMQLGKKQYKQAFRINPATSLE